MTKAEQRLDAAIAARRLVSTYYQKACKVSDKAKQKERYACAALHKAHTELLAAEVALARGN